MAKLKYTTETFVAKLKEKFGDQYNYNKVIYTGSGDKVEIVCPIHGGWSTTASHAMRLKHGCPECTKEKKAIAKRNTVAKRFYEEIQELYPNYDFSKFIYTHHKMKSIVIGSLHGEFTISPNALWNGCGCALCGIEKTSSKRRATKKEEFFEVMKRVRPNYDFSKFVYFDGKTEGIVICPDHGEFLAKPVNLKSGRGCPNCQCSKGEGRIKELLTENQVIFEQQACFPDLRDKRVLPFDFYFPELNILIEYDGKQHFEEIKKFGGEKGHLLLKKHDKMKNEYCKRKGMGLLRIPYWDFKNIEEILVKEGILNGTQK